MTFLKSIQNAMAKPINYTPSEGDPKSTDFIHKGCERMLQEHLIVALRSNSNVFDFSTIHHKNNSGINCKAYGLELGFSGLPGKNCNRYVDIALAKIINSGENPELIETLCEVKIIEKKDYPFKGRWYKHIYNDDKAPITFNCLQKLYKYEYLVTDADEGQLVFDFIKMMACVQRIKPEKFPEMYQFVAIEGSSDFCPEKQIVDFFIRWKEHIKVNGSLPDELQIFEWEDFVNLDHGSQKPALFCNIDKKMGFKIHPLEKIDGYHHLLIEWKNDDSEKVWSFNQ